MEQLGQKENEETVFYAEYQNTGEGAATASRASFGKQLNDISNYNEAQIWQVMTDGILWKMEMYCCRI